MGAIAGADYKESIGRERGTTPPPGPPLRREGGVFRQFEPDLGDAVRSAAAQASKPVSAWLA